MSILSSFRVILVSFSALLCFVFAQDICGNVEVCLLKLSEGTHQINLKVTLNAGVSALSDIDASGYFYNLDDQTNAILTGGSPVLTSSNTVLTNSWTEVTSTGSVQVGFPFISASYSPTDVCVGAFQNEFNTGFIFGSGTCTSIKMVKQVDIDFALVVDTTGSMTDDIGDVQTGASMIINQLAVSSSSFRGAVVEYNDRPTSDDATIVQDLTDVVGDVQNAISSLVAGGPGSVGGDHPECVYEGLWTALTLGWDLSITTRRVTVLMGDAPGKECDPGGITMDDVIEAANYFSVIINPNPSVPGRQAIRQKLPQVEIKVPVYKRSPLTLIRTNANSLSNFGDFERLAKSTGGIAAAVPVNKISSAIINIIKGVDPITSTISALSVKLQCKTEDDTKFNNFVVTNPNRIDVPYSVRELFTNTIKNLIAQPGGRNAFSLQRNDQVAMTIVWKNEEGVQKSTILRTRKCTLG